MKILEKLISELITSMTRYQEDIEEKNERVSVENQHHIDAINQIITDSDGIDGHKSAYQLRENILEYIDNMKINIIDRLMMFIHGGDLRKYLSEVLERKEFRKSQLLSKESSELRDRQIMIGTATNGDDLLAKLDVLTKELKRKTNEVALALEKNDQNTRTCNVLSSKCQELMDNNRRLEKEAKSLHSRLTKELTALKDVVQQQKEVINRLVEENGQLNGIIGQKKTKIIEIKAKLVKITAEQEGSIKKIEELEGFIRSLPIAITSNFNRGYAETSAGRPYCSW